MKSIKYLMLAVASVFMLASCSDKDVDVDAPWNVVNNNQAQVQIMYYTSVVSNATNNVYKIELGGQVLENNGAAMITPYNGAPGGSTGLFYTIPAGKNHLRLLGKDDAVILDKDFTVEGGKKYQVFMTTADADPVLIEVGTIPTMITTDTGEYAAARLYNFMWETPGVPFGKKIQLFVQDSNTKEYLPMGKPVGFGEATEWLLIPIHKTIFNSSGYQRIEIDYKVVEDDGTLVDLEYMNSSGNMRPKFTDYFSTVYIGRGYCWILQGTRAATTKAITTTAWTLR